MRREPAETHTTGGLHLPERDASRPLRGTVLAVGPGRLYPDGRQVAPAVWPGDVVLHARYAGTECRFDEHDCLVLREVDILGVIEEEIPGTAAETPGSFRQAPVRAGSRSGKTLDPERAARIDAALADLLEGAGPELPANAYTEVTESSVDLVEVLEEILACDVLYFEQRPLRAPPPPGPNREHYRRAVEHALAFVRADIARLDAEA